MPSDLHKNIKDNLSCNTLGSKPFKVLEVMVHDRDNVQLVFQEDTLYIMDSKTDTRHTKMMNFKDPKSFSVSVIGIGTATALVGGISTSLVIPPAEAIKSMVYFGLAGSAIFPALESARISLSKAQKLLFGEKEMTELKVFNTGSEINAIGGLLVNEKGSSCNMTPEEVSNFITSSGSLASGIDSNFEPSAG